MGGDSTDGAHWAPYRHVTEISYLVRLDEVEVGGIRVKGVDAAIVEGGYPTEILLGMSFLRSVGFSERAGVLTLTQDF